MPTMQQNTILPAPPRFVPGQEPRDYVNQLNRWLDNLYRYMTDIQYLRASGMYLPGLPKSAYGLRVDEVYSNDGVLTLVQTGDIGIGSLTMGSAVGTVTVTV